LSVGFYTVVVFGTTEGGIFAVNIWQSDKSGSSMTSTTMWNPPTNSRGSACTADVAVTVPTIVHNFTPSFTGQYDVYIFADNGTFVSSSGSSSFDIAAAIYPGTVFFNTANGNTTCGANGGAILAYYESSTNAMILQNVTLVAGQAYTVVASGHELLQTAYLGISVRASIVFTTGTGRTATVPDKSTSGTCTPYATPLPVFAFTFTAEYPTYILDTQEAFGTTYDTWSFLYRGTWDAAVDPPTCPIVFQGDTGDVTPLAVEGLTIGQNYTIFVTPFNQGATNTGPFALYFFSGSQLGGNFTTGGNTGGNGVDTNAIDTNMPTGNGVDTNAINTNMPTGMNPSTAPNSSAVSIFVGMVALIVALLF
jgi:hypothetical protein